MGLGRYCRWRTTFIILICYDNNNFLRVECQILCESQATTKAKLNQIILQEEINMFVNEP